MSKLKKIEFEQEPQRAITVSFLAEPMALGDVFLQSGMFKDIKTKAEAVVKILAGKELGLAPLESMTNIYIVNGKVALQSKIIGALIKKSKKYDYTINKLDNQECDITFFKYENGQRTEIGKSNFTFKDAAAAGLVNKEVWKNYPRNMLFARAISNGARWFTADVFSGYATEEVADIRADESLDAQAEVIDFDAEGEAKNEENIQQ